jgi:iron complex outermembrane recepter protein
MEHTMKKILINALMIAIASNAFAQSSDEAKTLDDIIVSAEKPKETALQKRTAVASGLGLRALETPASVDSVDLRDQALRGARTVAEATRGVTGLTYTTRAGAPGVFATRGFTENALVTLYDGVRVQSATITARAYDPFNFERIEVLRGPASLVHGEGASAGAVNYVRRKPKLGAIGIDGVLEVGSEDRRRAGLAVAGGLSEKLGFNVSASHQDSGSFVESLDSKVTHAVASLGGKLGERSGFLIEGDFFRGRVDDAYFGTSLVAGRIDERIFERNYNQSSSNRMDDDVTWGRAVFTHSFSAALEYSGQVYGYQADRDWQNFYAFSYLAGPPEQIEARNVESLAYDHDLHGTRHDLRFSADLGDVRSRSFLSLDYSATDFSSPRRDGGPSTGAPRPRFDVRNPQPASFVQGPRLRQREAEVEQTAVAFEQRFEYQQFAFTGGVRRSDIDALISRPQATPAVLPFRSSFKPTDWRAAFSYAPNDTSLLYVSGTTGAEPVESLLLLPLSQANFRLAKARGVEAGYKAQWDAWSFTGAAYQLDKDRLPSVNPSNPNLPPQVGKQESKGYELALRYDAETFSAGLNLANVDAEFKEFSDFGTFRDGVRPANVAEWVANADIIAKPWQAWTVGGYLQYVDARPSNNSNTLFLPSYTTLDLFAQYQISDAMSLTLRVPNATDKRYVEWATQSFGQNNLYFGSPRRYELSLGFKL